MPNPAWTEAYKEALACAVKNDPELDTLEIYHPSANGGVPFYLVLDRVDHNFNIEGGALKAFIACAFRFTLPPSGENGSQDLNLELDNTDRRIGDFIDAAKDSNQPVTIKYRPYLVSDPTTPCMSPPLVLFLRDCIIAGTVSGKASFADIVNKKFATLLYTRTLCPSLAN